MCEFTVESVEINGTELYFSINTENEDLPIILYLHGGPGDACIPLTEKFNSDLGEKYIFVNLEQRGSGLSYYSFARDESLNVASIIEDIYSFVNYLLKRFSKEKIILMGHSWGSALGLIFIKKYPNLINYYIGIGQVVNMKKNLNCQINFLKSKMNNLNKLNSLNFDKDIISSTLYVTKKVVQFGGSVYKRSNYWNFYIPFIFSNKYNTKKIFYRLRGSKQSIDCFWEELMEVDFEKDIFFDVPILFIEGRHDYHVSSILVDEYSKNIQSEVSICWFNRSAHFPHWEEPDKFNHMINSLENRYKYDEKI